MVNKRRRRAIIVWVTLVIVLIGQTPNLVFNSRLFRHSSTNPRVEGANGKHSRESAATKATGSGLPEAFVEGHLALPPGRSYNPRRRGRKTVASRQRGRS
jgi:hypothetical protein